MRRLLSPLSRVNSQAVELKEPKNKSHAPTNALILSLYFEKREILKFEFEFNF
jgi:hypothetical protein